MAKYGFGLYVFDSQNRLYLVKKPQNQEYSEKGRKWVVPGETYDSPLQKCQQQKEICRILASETPIDMDQWNIGQYCTPLGCWTHYGENGSECMFDNFLVSLREPFEVMKNNGKLEEEEVIGNYFSLLELPVNKMASLTKDFFRSSLFHSNPHMPSSAEKQDQVKFNGFLEDNSRRFFLIRRVGGGGYGGVYAALDIATLLPLAIKIPIPNPNDNLWHDRFINEGKTLLTLINKKVGNIERIFSINRINDERFYLQKEFIKGRNLGECYQEISKDKVYGIIRTIVQTLNEVHQLNICHRDLKPNNIMVELFDDRDPKVTLIDFGLVKNAKPSLDASSESTSETFRTGSPIYQSLITFNYYSCHTPLDDYYSILHVYYLLICRKSYYESIMPDLSFDKVKEEVRGLKSNKKDPFLDNDLQQLDDCIEDCEDHRSFIEFHRLIKKAYEKILGINDGRIDLLDAEKLREPVGEFCKKISRIFE